MYSLVKAGISNSSDHSPFFISVNSKLLDVLLIYYKTPFEVKLVSIISFEIVLDSINLFLTSLFIINCNFNNNIIYRVYFMNSVKYYVFYLQDL